MFKEDYIKDNELIKPDEAFMKRLKTAVEKEKEVTVNQEPKAEYEEIIRQRGDNSEIKKTITFPVRAKKLLAMAACIAILFGVGFLRDDIKNYLISNHDNLQGKTFLTSNSNEEVKEVYISFKTFIQKDVYIYEVKSFDEDAIANKEQLSRDERDSMIGAILADDYSLTEDKTDFSSARYYIVMDSEGNAYYYIIDGEKYIYIEKKNTSILG